MRNMSGKISLFVANCVILINSIQAGENLLAKPDIKWRISVANGAEASARKLDTGSWEFARQNDSGKLFKN